MMRHGKMLGPRVSSGVSDPEITRLRHALGVCFERYEHEGRQMIYYALVFLIVGLVAGALGLAAIAGVASQIAWVLFLIGIVLLVVQMLRGRTPPVT
jgi:uncharacterized membrane protein YtjA (UPF0391 family)